MRNLKVNSGRLSGQILDIQHFEGFASIDLLNRVYYTQNNELKCIESSLTLYVPNTNPRFSMLKAGDFVIARTYFDAFDAQGNNNSQFKVHYHYVYEFETYIDANTYANLANDGASMITANNYLLGGNVGNVETKQTANNVFSNISIALNRSFKDENGNWQDAPTVWTRLVVNGNMMKTLPQKGDLLLVDSEVRTSQYQDQHGNQVVTNDFRLNRVIHHIPKAELDAIKSARTQQSAPTQQQAPAMQPPVNQQAMHQQAPVQTPPAMHQPVNQAPMQQQGNAQPAAQANGFNQGQFRQ
ncbi:single-stranded DNA-binding protein (plasmid) [Vibrio sp. SS-MA-C1-2]|uniref:single-stranded DNA-binding protein n=1 Tax=Vibrio sp. SS-MA-C1-2 TaxID=2908646 RepID=UPI001F34B22A|nr:single-stranded DNA-binding protein [Vibrio sp. SS-MA-C1-2]UJF20272.1 single-stranded DNA-binding protein [Vibrio sp. SS-MA-C1-2]